MRIVRSTGRSGSRQVSRRLDGQRIALRLAAMPLLSLPLLGGCAGSSGPSFSTSSDTFDSKWGVSSSQRVVATGPIPKGGGHYKLGRPYQIGGRWYVPRHEPYYDRTGVGSWYGTDFHGRKTANGEIFDMNALTAAHPTLPMPSYAYVTNMRNGRTILVRINDRGPYVANREIDLSRASARALGYEQGGLGKVRVRWAGHAPLGGDDRREQAFLRNQPWNGGPVARFERPVEPYDERSYRQPPRERYAQDMNRGSDATYDRPADRYEPYDQRRENERRYDGRGYAQRKPDGYEAEYGATPRQPDYDGDRRPMLRPQRAAELETSSYDRPSEQETPGEQMWSPFSHREQLKTTSRR